MRYHLLFRWFAVWVTVRTRVCSRLWAASLGYNWNYRKWPEVTNRSSGKRLSNPFTRRLIFTPASWLIDEIAHEQVTCWCDVTLRNGVITLLPQLPFDFCVTTGLNWGSNSVFGIFLEQSEVYKIQSRSCLLHQEHRGCCYSPAVPVLGGQFVCCKSTVRYLPLQLIWEWYRPVRKYVIYVMSVLIAWHR